MERVWVRVGYPDSNPNHSPFGKMIEPIADKQHCQLNLEWNCTLQQNLSEVGCVRIT